MRVILLQDVKNVGKKGQSVEVSDGYASNFLIPKRLAVIETSRSVEVLNKQIQDKKDAETQEREKAQEVARQLASITLEFVVQVGADQKMFGSISAKQIESELKGRHNILIDKRRFIDKVAINNLGYSRLRIDLYKGIEGVVNVHVVKKE
ncbi:MAG TPA: 50S ribosomal protein L9 [Bacilli bacterium]|jgi:large subunit ribosomal protein L9|nr:50S ribosomal protein L9 [Bacilli bacterium]HOC80270.1 50S ribosomal protein L9 [Bacilli bacterium]